MLVGIALPHYDFSFPDGAAPGRATFERVASYAQRAEALGFHEAWVSDHFWIDLARLGGEGRYGTPECWSLLAGLAVRTSAIRLGTLVINAGIRSPTLLAKMTGTLDRLTDGRLDLGLGAGWEAHELEANGLAFPPAPERLARLEETLGVLRALLADEPGSFAGTYYHAAEAPVVPGPVQQPRPPLWVAGKGDRLLGVAARAGDGWNYAWRATPETYGERVAALDRACVEANREPADVRRSLGLLCLVGRDADDLVARWERLGAWAPPGTAPGGSLRDYAASCLVGTPPEIVSQLRAWEDAGVEQVICSFAHLPFAVCDDEQLELMADLLADVA